MPELPEVEHLRRSLEPNLLGVSVSRARLHRADFARVLGSSRGVSPRHLLEGADIVELRRLGKHLAIIARDGRALDVHLGMSGQVIFVPPPRADAPDSDVPPPPTHVHARWSLVQDAHPAGELLFRDPRRFGGLVALPHADLLDATLWASLGPDALSISSRELVRALAGSRRAIKALLLDQSALAGVGNIYADEALFRARLRPMRPASTLSPSEITALASAIRRVLARAVASGGSTLRDYVDANGVRGSFQDRHAVYGQGGNPCRRCGIALREITLAQRTTVFCTSCQR